MYHEKLQSLQIAFWLRK